MDNKDKITALNKDLNRFLFDLKNPGINELTISEEKDRLLDRFAELRSEVPESDEGSVEIFDAFKKFQNEIRKAEDKKRMDDMAEKSDDLESIESLDDVITQNPGEDFGFRSDEDQELPVREIPDEVKEQNINTEIKTGYHEDKDRAYSAPAQETGSAEGLDDVIMQDVTASLESGVYDRGFGEGYFATETDPGREVAEGNPFDMSAALFPAWPSTMENDALSADIPDSVRHPEPESFDVIKTVPFAPLSAEGSTMEDAALSSDDEPVIPHTVPQDESSPVISDSPLNPAESPVMQALLSQLGQNSSGTPEDISQPKAETSPAAEKITITDPYDGAKIEIDPGDVADYSSSVMDYYVADIDEPVIIPVMQADDNYDDSPVITAIFEAEKLSPSTPAIPAAAVPEDTMSAADVYKQARESVAKEPAENRKIEFAVNVDPVAADELQIKEGLLYRSDEADAKIGQVVERIEGSKAVQITGETLDSAEHDLINDTIMAGSAEENVLVAGRDIYKKVRSAYDFIFTGKEIISTAEVARTAARLESLYFPQYLTLSDEEVSAALKSAKYDLAKLTDEGKDTKALKDKIETLTDLQTFRADAVSQITVSQALNRSIVNGHYVFDAFDKNLAELNSSFREFLVSSDIKDLRTMYGLETLSSPVAIKKIINDKESLEAAVNRMVLAQIKLNAQAESIQPGTDRSLMQQRETLRQKYEANNKLIKEKQALLAQYEVYIDKRRANLALNRNAKDRVVKARTARAKASGRIKTLSNSVIRRGLQESDSYASEELLSIMDFAGNKYVRKGAETAKRAVLAVPKVIGEKSGINQAVLEELNIVKDKEKEAVNKAKQAAKEKAEEAAKKNAPKAYDKVQKAKGGIGKAKAKYADSAAGKATSKVSRAAEGVTEGFRSFKRALNKLKYLGLAAIAIILLIMALSDYGAAVLAVIASPFESDEQETDLSPYYEIINSAWAGIVKDADKQAEELKIQYLAIHPDVQVTINKNGIGDDNLFALEPDGETTKFWPRNSRAILAMTTWRFSQDLKIDTDVDLAQKTGYITYLTEQLNPVEVVMDNVITYHGGSSELREYDEDCHDYDDCDNYTVYYKCRGHKETYYCTGKCKSGYDTCPGHTRKVYCFDGYSTNRQGCTKYKKYICCNGHIDLYELYFPYQLISSAEMYGMDSYEHPFFYCYRLQTLSAAGLNLPVLAAGKDYLTYKTEGVSTSFDTIDQYGQIADCIDRTTVTLKDGRSRTTEQVREHSFDGWADSGYDTLAELIYNQNWVKLYSGDPSLDDTVSAGYDSYELLRKISKGKSIDFETNPDRAGTQAIVDTAVSFEGEYGDMFYSALACNEVQGGWCGCFVGYVLKASGYYDSVGLPTAATIWSPPRTVSYLKEAGIFRKPGDYAVPVAGDMIFFDWEGDGWVDHIGIVVGTYDGKVVTIEGNSRDRVRYKCYDLGSAVIYGYGTPEYECK